MLRFVLNLTLAALTASPDGARSTIAATETHKSLSRQGVVMGTPWALNLTSSERQAALLASETVVLSLAESESRLSNWSPDSELSRWNRTVAGCPLPCSPTLAREIYRADQWRILSGGAFSPLTENLVEAWDLRGVGRFPNPLELGRALDSCDPQYLTWFQGQPVRHGSLRIASGGFGKGAALDFALQSLGERNSASISLNLGGQVLVANRTEWVDIAHPSQRHRSIGRWRIDSGSLATSGNSERGLTVEGVRFGHILDARSGRPAEDFGSVTVWCDNALDADCLSTALFALGPDAGLRLAASLPGVRALFIENTNDPLRLRATQNCQPYLSSEQTILWFPELHDIPPHTHQQSTQ